MVRKFNMQVDLKGYNKLLQEHAKALYKYGKQYPEVFPNALKRASELYKMDRQTRGIEE